MTTTLDDKLTLLSAAAEFDICTSCPSPSERFAPAITRLLLPNGRSLSVLKILMTDACQYDCYYCANRADRRCRRHSFTPDELAATFMEMRTRGLVSGMFLSSGVHGSPAATMQDMLTSVEILREKDRFHGYVHLKILPRAPCDAVERAVALADRVSVNMEAPTQQALSRLSGSKHLAEDVIKRMHWIRQAADRAGPGRLRSGQTTQFVVGAAGESDRQLLTASEGLRRSVGLRRAYFSAFRPVPDTPLEGEPPTPAIRQHRLYQADWLLRCYGFGLSDLAFDDAGHLPLNLDPKLGFALTHPEEFPVEVNRAPRHQLLRVPGIGPRSADRIVAARGQARLTSLNDLRPLGVVARRAAPFVLVNGRRDGRILDLLRAGRAAADQPALPFLDSDTLAAVGV